MNSIVPFSYPFYHPKKEINLFKNATAAASSFVQLSNTSLCNLVNETVFNHFRGTFFATYNILRFITSSSSTPVIVVVAVKFPFSESSWKRNPIVSAFITPLVLTHIKGSNWKSPSTLTAFNSQQQYRSCYQEQAQLLYISSPHFAGGQQVHEGRRHTEERDERAYSFLPLKWQFQFYCSLIAQDTINIRQSLVLLLPSSLLVVGWSLAHKLSSLNAFPIAFFLKWQLKDPSHRSQACATLLRSAIQFAHSLIWFRWQIGNKIAASTSYLISYKTFTMIVCFINFQPSNNMSSKAIDT